LSASAEQTAGNKLQQGCFALLEFFRKNRNSAIEAFMVNVSDMLKLQAVSQFSGHLFHEPKHFAV